MSTLAPQMISLRGHSLSYVDSGSGDAVLFVHGLLGSNSNWAHLIHRLDDRNRVIVPDLFATAPRRTLRATTRSAPMPRPCATSSTDSASAG